MTNVPFVADGNRTQTLTFNLSDDVAGLEDTERYMPSLVSPSLLVTMGRPTTINIADNDGKCDHFIA